MHVITDRRVDHFRIPNAGGFHDRDLRDQGIGDRIHDAPLIGERVPSAWSGSALSTEDKVPISPLAQRQLGRRLERLAPAPS